MDSAFKLLVGTACAVVIVGVVAGGGLYWRNSQLGGCDRALALRDGAAVTACERRGALPIGTGLRLQLEDTTKFIRQLEASR